MSIIIIFIIVILYISIARAVYMKSVKLKVSEIQPNSNKSLEYIQKYVEQEYGFDYGILSIIWIFWLPIKNISNYILKLLTK